LILVCSFLAQFSWPQSAVSDTPAPPTPVAGTNGGSERVAVVVNSNSWASQTVANEYIRLRNVPACNVIYIDAKDWPSFETTNLEFFKTKLLSPVLDEIKNRGLTPQIDCIAYSSDFPFYIDGSSLTGLTYLHELVMAKTPDYLGLSANWYFHGLAPFVAGTTADPFTRGFSSQTAWDKNGQPVVGPGGRHYMLSTMLGYTSGRGNSVSEVIACLRRSAAADGTCPKGTIYFANNDGIRATTRTPGFAAAIAALEKLGISAKTTGNNPDVNHNPDLPMNKDDVIAGAMLGRAFQKCKDSKATVLPGAIVENLTSEGGDMSWGGGQSPDSDYIRFGAAGTSGTVIEPSALWPKFPAPSIQVHYASGSTLAEAFYQSVYGPYQLLIWGDPLCEPWAKIPRVDIKGASGDIKINGKYSLVAQAVTAAPQWSQAELFIDGKFVAKIEKNKPNELDGAKLGNGWHEIRVTAISGGPLQTRGGCIVWAQVGDDSKQLTCTADKKQVGWNDQVKLKFSAPGAQSVEFLCNSVSVARAKGESGEVTIDAAKLGMGVCRIYPVAGVPPIQLPLRGKPIEIEVLPPPLHAALTDVPADDKLSPGLLLWAKGKTPYVVTDMRKKPTIETAKIDKGEPFEFDGYFGAPSDDVYQFQFMFTGKLDVKIDGQDFPLPPAGKYWRLVPISLAKGTHRFQASGASTDSRDMEFRFGGPGSRCPYAGPKNANGGIWPAGDFRHLTAQEGKAE
jgi:hypothetical protein